MSTTPPAVLVEFVHALSRMNVFEEGLVPVLRGSLLLHHWYGDRARPPADIDIECFVRPDAPREYDPDEPPYGLDEQFYGPPEGRFGQYGEYVSRIDFGKAMCRYAARSADYRRPGGGIGLTFAGESDPPAGGNDLWVYGTPGQRYFAKWTWPGHRPDAGRLQLDLSTPGPYAPDDLGVSDETFVAPGDVSFRTPAYSREAMLAAKVSWLVRGLARRLGQLSWAGEPKDLFDAHLLATADRLRPDVFRRAMLAVGAADALDWNTLDVLFEVRPGATPDSLFSNWDPFARAYPKLTTTGPVALWTELADRLGPLLGDLCPVAEMPFLRAVNAAPADHAPLLVYADWLDDHRGDDRGRLVRLIAKAVPPEFADLTPDARHDLIASLSATSQPWLHQLFGTSARLQSFRDAISFPEATPAARATGE